MGTTNSAIGRMTPRGPETIPIKRLKYIPSAVAVDKRGDLKVGADALNPHFQVARWFKRLMGTENTLPVGGDPWSPQRLSSEVLKALKAAAKVRTNEDIEDVVITVPAMFSQPQCAATNEAANQAGLNAVALLQEPIAAATAYLSDNPAEGYYLVYDLGGGTFDVSLIRLGSGEMSVVEHGGDNYLGGADFDRAIFDWVLEQVDTEGGDIRPFETDGWQRTQLMLECERAREEVSDLELATIYLDDFDLPLAKIELPRETAEDLVSDLVTRTIEIAQERVKRAGTKPRSVLLVGGPTQMPYIRGRLQDELGLPLSFDQDPMTVVAQGAAVHASTLLRRPRVAATSKKRGSASLFLNYEPVSPDETTVVAGKVTDPEDFEGEVRLRTSGGLWESGWRALKNSAFSFEVPLGRTVVTEYEIELRDRTGKPIQCSPSGFSIRSGVRAAQPVTPYNYGVVRQGGNAIFIVKENQPLPASGVDEFVLAKTIVAGSNDEAVIYFVEGHSLIASDNVKVAELRLKGTDIQRTLKEGEKVEIRIRVDESRRATAKVYVPMLDVDFSVELHQITERPAVEDLEDSLIETRQTIDDIKDKVDGDEKDVVLQIDRQLELIEAHLERAQRGETGEAERVAKQLSDVKARLRPLRDKYELQARYDGLVEFIDEAEDLCQRFGDRLGLAKLGEARADAAKALRNKQQKAMDTVKDRVRDVFWEHYGKTRECWEYQVELAQERAFMARDPLSYAEYLRRAERGLEAEDFAEVRINILRCLQLLPERAKVHDRYHSVALR